MKSTTIIISLLLGVNIFSQSLDEYIEIAKENNSKIKVQKALYELDKEKANEVATYENTTFSTGVFALTPETRVGSQLFKIGASQKLPWFGELDAKRDLANTKANLKQYDVVLSERDIAFQVKNAYYQIYQQEAITAILKENKLILITYENMALAALENNRATMSDVLRIRVQKNELHSKMFQNLNSLETLKENFNRLLQRDVKASLNFPDSLNVLDIFIGNTNINKHPSLEKIQSKKEVYQAEKKVIYISEKPKLAVGLDYILVNKRSDANPIQNGKDILMPKVSIAIPLFNKRKYKSKLEQVKIKEKMLQDELEAQKTQLEIAIEQAKLDLDNAILTVVAAQKNKAEIQRAINVDLKAYETGILDYDKILRLQLQKIRFQLMEVEATKKAFIAAAKVAYLRS
jgi:outer membrane protein TolC